MHQLVILHLPLAPPSFTISFIESACSQHFVADFVHLSCMRSDWNRNRSWERAAERGKSATRAAACGLGFSIKLFCGRSDNQTIVQYILFECFARPPSRSQGSFASRYLLLQLPLMYNSNDIYSEIWGIHQSN